LEDIIIKIIEENRIERFKKNLSEKKAHPMGKPPGGLKLVIEYKSQEKSQLMPQAWF